ncbi:MAG: flagellar FliJ family protein [Ruminococcus sp.]|nr:flagellar FliJ family protein [Ruminococcus sp.]
MKKFEFTLSRIRDYKNSMLSKEKNVLAGLRMEQKNIEDRLAQLKINAAKLNNDMHEKISVGLTAGELKIYDFRRNVIRDEVQALNNRSDFLLSSIELQQKRVEKLKQEVSGYDNLEDNQRQAYNEAAAKEQEQIIAEFISQKITREINNV